MLKVNHDKVKEIIREVARAEIMPRFRHLKDCDISFKTGDDPVTIADKEAENALTKRLTALLPGSKVLGEEAFAVDSSLLRLFSDESPVWTVDPVDGTRNFVAGNPIFGVIVALTERNQAVAGWLYDPNSDEFISAEKGAGAYHNGKRLKTLPPDMLESMVGSMGYEIKIAYEKCGLANNEPKPRWEKSLVCACHEYARLVVGQGAFANDSSQLHYYCWLNSCTPWDNTAGILIHSEAGGYTAHWNGDNYKPSSYKKGMLSAPDFESWRELRNWVAKICKLEP